MRECMHTKSRVHTAKPIDKAAMSAAKGREGPTFAPSGTDIHTRTDMPVAPVRTAHALRTRMHAPCVCARSLSLLARHLPAALVEV